MVTMQQDKVVLYKDSQAVTFDWPYGSDTVVIKGDTPPTVYSVEEADDLFWALLNAGAY